MEEISYLVAVDKGGDHTMSVLDWQHGEKGCKITETKWNLAATTVSVAHFVLVIL